MSAGSSHLNDSWHSFLRQWKGLRAEWNDAVSDEVARRWIDNWGTVIGNYEESLRESEAFLRQAGHDAD